MFLCSLTGAQGDLLAAGVLQHVLGAEPRGYLKWGSTPSGRYVQFFVTIYGHYAEFSLCRLHRAGALASDLPFSVSPTVLLFP